MRNISFSEISNELVNIFTDDSRLEDYNYNCVTCTGVSGWAGVMSPKSRKAFIKVFGLQTVVLAEADAKMRIEANKRQYEATAHAAHVAEADGNTSGTPTEGSFWWAIETGLKNEGDGMPGTIADCVRYPDTCRRVLVGVQKVYHVTEEEFANRLTPDRLVAEANGDFPGGACNEDETYKDLKDEYKTWYTIAAAVVDPSGRWYLVDAEGYNYARYILLPEAWGDILKPEADAARAAEEARIEAERIEAERIEAEEKADYQARCEKWAPLMVDVRPLEAAAKEAYKLHGWKSQERRDAERKLQAAQRANIKAMVKAVYPGLKVSIRKNSGWGADYELTYSDGPTLKEFEAAVDLRLFAVGHDTFDGMTDTTGYEREKYTSFATVYMGENGADIRAWRY